ncbi:MAG: rhodanese-like domain-containing protein [Methylocystaceae bacterium]
MFFGSFRRYQNIKPSEAQEKLKQPNTILLDVRMPEEYARNHIPGSILIPLDELGQRVKSKIPDPNTAIIVYCQSGGRSSRAADQLSKLGYNEIFNLGGINSWPYKTQSGR